MSFRKLLITIISVNLFIFSALALSSAPSKVKDNVVLTPYEICSQKNEDTRNLSIKQARRDYEKAVKGALLTRNDAVDYALTISDEDEQDRLKEIAYTEYKDTQSSAQDEYLALRKIALKKFDIEQRKCRARTYAEHTQTVAD